MTPQTPPPKSDSDPRPAGRPWLRRLGLGLLIALALGILAAGFALQTETVRGRALSYGLDQVNARIAGTLAAEAWSGSLWDGVTLHAVRLDFEGETLAEIESLSLAPAWLEFLQGRLYFSKLELVAPKLIARQAEDSDWNLLRAVATAESPRTRTPSAVSIPIPIRLASVEILRGEASIEPQASEPLRLIDLDAEFGVLLHGVRLRGELHRLNVTLAQQGRPAIVLDAVAQVRFRGSAQRRIEIERLRMRTADSKIESRGRIDLGQNLDLTTRIETIAARDLTALVPSLALQSDITGQLQIRGDWSRAQANGELRSATARFGFEATTDLERPALDRSELTFRFSAPNLARWLPAHGIAGALEANGELKRGQGKLHATLSHPGGRATAQGTFSLPGSAAEPGRFGFDLRSQKLDLARIRSDRPEWRSALDFDARVEGQARDAASLAADVHWTLAPSTIGGIRIERGRGDLRVTGETLDLARSLVVTNLGQIEVTGRAGLSAEAPLALEAQVDVTELEPLLALARVAGEGALRGQLTLTGTRGEARLMGTLKAAGITLEGQSAETADLSFDVSGLPNGPAMGEATLALSGVAAGPYRGAAEIDLALSSAADARDDPRDKADDDQAFALDIALVEYNDLSHRIAVHGRRSARGIAATIDRLDLQSGLETWRLTQPVAFDFINATQTLRLGDARLRAGSAAFAVQGVLSRSEAQQFRASGQGLSLARLAALARLDREVARRLDGDLDGELAFEFALEGPAARPDLAAHLEIDGLTLAGGAQDAAPPEDLDRLAREAGVERATAHLRIQNGQADFEIALVQSADRVVEAKGRLPIRFGLLPELVLEPAGELSAEIRSEAFALDFFAPLLSGTADRFAGIADLDLRISGPLDQLRPVGRLQIREGVLRPLATEVAIEQIEATATIESDFRSAIVLSAVAGEGRLQGTGQAHVDWLGLHQLEVDLEITRWPVLRTRAYSITSSGQLRAEAEGRDLRLVGRIAVDQGTLRPDLEFLIETPPERDPTIRFENSGDPAVPSANALATPEVVREAPGSLFDRLELDVRVDVERDLWIRHPKAAVELYGDVRARKDRDKSLYLEGDIGTHRGWVTLQGRRFRLVEGKLSFLGGDPIDPELDVLARYKLPEYTIDASLSGPASKPTLVLSSDPSLEQPDILSVLLFGRPISQLSEREQTSLGSQATSLAQAYGMTAAGKTLAAALGFEAAGIQLEELSQDRASLGAYLGRRTFVSVTQEFQNERGQQLSIEFELWPGWSIVTSTTSTGTNSADLIWKLRY